MHLGPPISSKFGGAVRRNIFDEVDTMCTMMAPIMHLIAMKAADMDEVLEAARDLMGFLRVSHGQGASLEPPTRALGRPTRRAHLEASRS